MSQYNYKTVFLPTDIYYVKLGLSCEGKNISSGYLGRGRRVDCLDLNNRRLEKTA
jgi:hypothetical protein